MRPPAQGTSPRTRGKLITKQMKLSFVGNIPAHAGKTIALNKYLTAEGEHPRARGENG